VCILLLFGFLLVACSAGSRNREDFLYDFDHMMQLMEETFPYFGVAERRLGINIHELAANTREIIANYPYSLQLEAYELGIELDEMPDLDGRVFWSILRHEFFQPLSYLGNARVPDMPRGVAEEGSAPYRFIFRDEPQQIRDEVFTMEILEEERIAYLGISTFDVGNFQDYHPRMDRFLSSVEDYDHLIIDIRDNAGGRIDFWRMLLVYTLWPNRSETQSAPLYAFHRDDRDEIPPLNMYAFFKGGELNRSLADMQIEREASAARFIPDPSGLFSVNGTSDRFPDLNRDDSATFAYGVRLDAGIGMLLDAAHFHRVPERMWIPRTRIPFNGQVWLLIGENNRSASALFAHHARYTGFATLVGEQTGGGYAWTANEFFTLPNSEIVVSWNTGYLTDQYGSALEEFPTEPHYFNREGMDALETVLEIINGGVNQ